MTVISSAALFSFFLYAGSAVTQDVAAADRISLLSVFAVNKPEVAESVQAVRGQVAVKGVYSFSSDQANQIALKAGITNRTIVTVQIGIELLHGQRIEMSTPYPRSREASHFWKTKNYQLVLGANATGAQVLQQLYDQIQTDQTFRVQGEEYFGVTITDTAGVKKLTFTCSDPEYALDFAVSDGEQEFDVSETITTFAAVTEKTPFEGTNNENFLRVERLQTDVTNQPWMGNISGRELPVGGALYTSIMFKQNIKHPELSGGSVNGQDVSQTAFYEIYIKEGGAEEEALINKILTWLNTAGEPAKVTKTFTDKNGAPVSLAAFLANA